MKKFILIVAIVLAVSPLTLLAQLPVATDACMQAQMDAQADVDGTLWFWGGCLFGLLGVGAAYVIEPTPPATRLMGQPPDYVAIYTDCYKQKGKSIQTSAAIKGCVVGQLVYWGCYFAYYAMVLAAASETYYY